MNGNRVYWDFFIILLAIYNAITLPMEVSFNPPFLSRTIVKMVNVLIDFIFAIDILICFRTTYICSETGAEIIEGCKIAKNYLVGRFLIDLISTIPFDVI